MKACEYIASILSQNNINNIFGYIGGFNQDIVDAIHRDNKIHFVLNYHEQASAFAANAYATITGKPSVTMSSGAPSSCNLVAGIANAYFDSVPCIFIVGSVHSLSVRTTKKIRQNAFEEIDMVSLVSDITKYAVKIEKSEDVRYYLEKAFYIANEGRKGPVLLDIPYDIARNDIHADELRAYSPEPFPGYDEIDTSKIKQLLYAAKKPVILLGGGARSEEARQKVRSLLDKVKIPVVASLCGLDVLPHNHECFMGFIGHYGNRYANLAVANCDFLLVLGSRLDERQLGGYKTRLQENCKVIRVDIDKIELGRKIPEDLSIHSSTENFLEEILKENFEEYDSTKWLNVISNWKERYPSHNPDRNTVDANNFLHFLSDYLPENTVVCSDVGQNQMCVAQALRLDDDRKLLNSAGYGSMGFSLPAAVGAAYATNKNTCILSVNGDGGLQMNIQELETVKRDNLPVNILILNNNCLGMIRGLQENLYENRNYVSIHGYSVPDYEALAKAYKIKYLKIDSVDQYELVRDFISTTEPTITELILPQKMKNYPEPGESIGTQVPFLSEEEYNTIQKEVLL